ncbi:MAG: phosphate/phosphite/phosphonate ABC transporter substrate-binding protein [Thiobacillus sp.]
MHPSLIACLAACWLMLVTPARADPALVVGVLPYQGARTLIAAHRDLAEHLRGALKRPVKIVTARNARVFGQRLLAGDYDLALAPAHLARLAQRDAGWHLLAMHRPDTPVYLMAESGTPGDPQPRAGITIATPDRAMLVTLAAQRWLDTRFALNAGDYTLIETGSYSAALQAVIDGQADFAVSALAAMGQVRPGHLDRVRIAHELGSVPLLVYIARPGWPAAGRSRLQAALLKFPVTAPLRVVAAGKNSLDAMDVYLAATRQLLTENEGLADAR